MAPDDKSMKTPANSETTTADSPANTEATPEQKPLDPKEIARQRSKADLERKRRNQRGNRGRF